MKIQCLIRRQKGSTVVLDGETYVFNAANGHTCDVPAGEHADRLLAIAPRTFVIAERAEQVAEPEADKQPDADPAPKAPRKPRTPKAPKA